MSKQDIQAKKRLNEGKPCKVEGCGSYRRGFSGFCSRHEEVVAHWGWPEGRALRREEYAWSFTKVEGFLTRKQEHPACRTALKWMEGFLRKPVMARVAEQGWQPMDLLIEACAVAHYFLTDAADMNEGHYLERSIGHALLRLAPGKVIEQDGRARYVAIRKTDRKAVGEEVMKKLGGFLANVTLSIRAEEIRKESARKNLMIPIVPPLPSY